MEDTVGQAILLRLNNIDHALKALHEKVDDLLDDYSMEDDTVRTVSSPDDFISEQEIRQHGQKIPYNKLEGKEEMAAFREFLTFVRMHENQFSVKEFEFAAFADKNFSDIRISDNSRRILGTAYQKAYRKPWKFNFVRGYMYKFHNQIAWEWQDGSTD